MVSFDVRSLFTNTALKKTIKICLDRLYRGNPDIKPTIPEKTLEKMLNICVSDNTFVFDGKVYMQIADEWCRQGKQLRAHLSKHIYGPS